MSRIRVILDACVLVPYQLADLLLRIADAELFKPLWSGDLLSEVERNIVKLGVQPDKAARRIAQMESASPNATVTGFEHLVPAMTTDPKDRHVAAAAVRGGAALIVTANMRDFPQEALARYDIEVVHPDDFLQDQLVLAEATVLTCLQRHRSAYVISPARTRRRFAAAPVPHGVRCLVCTATLDMIVPRLRSVSAHTQWEFVTVGGVDHLGML